MEYNQKRLHLTLNVTGIYEICLIREAAWENGVVWRWSSHLGESQ